MRMYGYKVRTGSDYIEWISAEPDSDGGWHAEWTVPVEQAYSGIIKLQSTCMVDGARSNVLELHFYHLQYDAGGGNCEWYGKSGRIYRGIVQQLRCELLDRRTGGKLYQSDRLG